MSALFRNSSSRLSTNEIEYCHENPAGFIKDPYSLVDAGLVRHQYSELVLAMDDIRLNLATFKNFTFKSSSVEWCPLCPDYKQALKHVEKRVDVFPQKMSFAASSASIKESQMDIQQNDGVKRLTQLDFDFIPLNFATSLFGMNLDVLGSGSAKIWMFVPTMIATYVSTGLLWIVLHLLNGVLRWLRACL